MPNISNATIRNEVKSLRDSIDRWRAAVDDDRRKMHDTLYGNGQPGIDEKVRDLQDITLSNAKNIERLIKRLDERDEKLQPVILFYKVGIWLAALLGTSIMAFLWGVFTHRVELIFH